MLRVQVVMAWPGRHVLRELQLPDGALLGDAIDAAGFEDLSEIAGHAVFGIVADVQTPLHDGDRVELLRALVADPKESRRRRADRQRQG